MNIMTSLSIFLIAFIAFSSFSVVMLSLVLYPLERCIWISLTFLFFNVLVIFSMSNLLSFSSICSYFIPKDFNELEFSLIPITSSKVSYGFPRNS